VRARECCWRADKWEHNSKQARLRAYIPSSSSTNPGRDETVPARLVINSSGRINFSIVNERGGGGGIGAFVLGALITTASSDEFIRLIALQDSPNSD